MGYSSKIWRVSLCREMSPSPEFGAQDVFKNKCLINFRWYRSARTTPPNPPPRASDRVADPQPAVRSPSDATEPAAPLCWWTSGWWEPAQVCLRGPAWLLQSSMETILIVLAFSLNMEGYPFHSIFFFFLEMIWILQRSVQGFYGRELRPNLTIKTRRLEDMTDPSEIDCFCRPEKKPSLITKSNTSRIAELAGLLRKYFTYR